MLLLVALALVASVYLYVSSQAVAAGVEIKLLQDRPNSSDDIKGLKLAIEDYETQLAYLTSEKVMRARAEDLDFEPVDPAEIMYISVDSYTGRPPVSMAPPPAIIITEPDTLPPPYTESLLEWFAKNLLTPSEFLAEVGK
jgi:hypothetical protein